MRAKTAIGALLITLLAGCTSVQDVSSSSHKVDADLCVVSVSCAAPNEQTREAPSSGEAIPELWESAVVETLNKSSVFVEIHELNLPVGGRLWS